MSTTCPDASLGQQCRRRDTQTLRHSGEIQTLRQSDTQTVPERVIRGELQQRDGGDGDVVHVIAVCLCGLMRVEMKVEA